MTMVGVSHALCVKAAEVERRLIGTISLPSPQPLLENGLIEEQRRSFCP